MIRLALLQRGNGLQLSLSALHNIGSIQIVGVLESVKNLLQQLEQLNVQALLLDLDEVGWDVIKVVEELMISRPLPIIALDCGAASLKSARFLAAGGVGVVVPTSPDDLYVLGLGEQILALAEVKVVRRRATVVSSPASAAATRVGEKPASSRAGSLSLPLRMVSDGTRPGGKLVVIGASTGGPAILQGLLSAWAGKGLPPVMIAQHISEGFGPSMVQWLQSSTGFQCCVATDAQALVPGCAYFAPDGKHLGVGCLGGAYHARVFPPAPSENCFPSANVLFQSAAEVAGHRCIALLLTGMGRDGADGLLAIRRASGVTMTQTAETCAVFGMPGEAIKLNASMINLDPAGLASETVRLLSL
jgi:two-component system, chemotaxis family, protein-glutamate methylesterase/glutaminase